MSGYGCYFKGTTFSSVSFASWELRGTAECGEEKGERRAAGAAGHRGDTSRPAGSYVTGSPGPVAPVAELRWRRWERRAPAFLVTG